MDKCFHTKALCARLATLLFHCSAVEYKKRVDFLNGLCDEWVLADGEPSQFGPVHRLCNAADSEVSSK